jgi:hypothetical protein
MTAIFELPEYTLKDSISTAAESTAFSDFEKSIVNISVFTVFLLLNYT